MLSGVAALTWLGATPAWAAAQQAAATAPLLVFNGVTVVDVERGKLVPEQRVVIVNHRIQAVGAATAVALPRGARVIDARGQYLMPGLWDMHVHVWDRPNTFYPSFIRYGVTGVREMSQALPIDSLFKWRRQMVAGARVGPRVIGTGGFLYGRPADPSWPPGLALTVTTPGAARHIVDSLQAAGADFIKVRDFLSRDVYFAALAEARRLGIPLVGHTQGTRVTEIESADSGQLSIEHISDLASCHLDPGGVVEHACTAVAAAFARNGTYFTPTLYEAEHPDPAQVIGLMRQAGVRLLAGSDVSPNFGEPGRAVHDELEDLTAAGLTPAEALRTATLNPALYLHGTDSLGTVAPRKLADLVLLDANPLEDIRHTQQIRAVVANGHYYDRAALDRLTAEAPASGPEGP